MKFIDEDEFFNAEGIVSTFICDQLDLYCVDANMSQLQRNNIRLCKSLWWFMVNTWVRDVVNNGHSYTCANLKGGLRGNYISEVMMYTSIYYYLSYHKNVHCSL